MTEEKIKKIWCEILGSDDIGVDESFFDLGGNSLTAMMIFEDIKAEFGCDIPVSELYNYDTISKISGFIDKIRRDA